MQAYAPYNRNKELNGVAQLSSQQAFVSALEQAKHEQFRLRLATEDDIDILDRLILGLADFEGEPESYILSKQQLKQDGFAGRPLYYCILMDDIGGASTSTSSVSSSSSTSTPYTCAMAFCYVACDLSGGRFLYLEDLFVEKEYRGKGGGKLVMSTLALVAQSLNCTKAVWQVSEINFDWGVGFDDGIEKTASFGLEYSGLVSTYMFGALLGTLFVSFIAHLWGLPRCLQKLLQFPWRRHWIGIHLLCKCVVFSYIRYTPEWLFCF